MRIKLLKGVVIDKMARTIGEEVEVSEWLGNQLLFAGRAIKVARPVTPVVAPETKKRTRKKSVKED